MKIAKKRIAFQYSGLLRTLKQCLPQVKKVFGDYEVDFFVSIWSAHDTKMKHRPSHSPYEDVLNPDLISKKIDKDLVNNFFQGLNLKSLDIEPFDKSIDIMKSFNLPLCPKISARDKHGIDENGNFCGTAQHQFISSYYKNERCNNLRKIYQKLNDVKYDWYMKFRPDLIIKKIPDLNSINEPDIAFINTYVWEDPNLIALQNPDNSMNENIFLTNSEKYINDFCGLYSNIDRFWNQSFYGEQLLGNFLINSEVIKNIQRFDFKLSILRNHGHCQIAGKTRTRGIPGS